MQRLARVRGSLKWDTYRAAPMTWTSRQALSTFWIDAGKAMLVTAIPCFGFDLIVLKPADAGLMGVLFLTAGVLFVPLGLFAVAATALVLLLRRPAWLLGPVVMLLLNSAFLHIVR